MGLAKMDFSKYDLERNSIEGNCKSCNALKMIPVIRESGLCDDCIDRIVNEREKKSVETNYINRMNRQRIPERYRLFGGKLEIMSDVYNYILQNRSVTISGHNGTGKTNLACQILIEKKTGQFYHSTEIRNQDIEFIQNLPYVVIDDLDKIDTTNQKRVEKIFEVFDFRYANKLPTIVTLDRTYDEIEIIYGNPGKALISRFRESYYNVVLQKDWRKK